MMKAFILSGLALLLTSTYASSNEEMEMSAYAVMQDCLAGAEQSFNEQTGLDRYCIDSYLNTRPRSMPGDE